MQATQIPQWTFLSRSGTNSLTTIHEQNAGSGGAQALNNVASRIGTFGVLSRPGQQERDGATFASSIQAPPTQAIGMQSQQSHQERDRATFDDSFQAPPTLAIGMQPQQSNQANADNTGSSRVIPQSLNCICLTSVFGCLSSLADCLMVM